MLDTDSADLDSKVAKSLDLGCWVVITEAEKVDDSL